MVIIMGNEWFGNKEKYAFWYEVYKMALNGMNIGLAGDVFSSGEENVLCLLEKMGKIETIFDVGANTGDYTDMLTRHFPNAKIHCFEPAKATFRVLKENIREKDNIILNNFGLSNRKGEQDLYYDQEVSGLASLYQRQLDHINIDFSHHEKIQLDTIDDYCERSKIESIDFLKMDIEGNELNALKGAAGLLKRGGIGAIQIEFGGCNIDSRTFFRDFWNLLHEDYSMYRILKDGLWEITNYTERLECFSYTNYFFVNKRMQQAFG